MKKITDLKPQIKKPTRYNVYLDNVFYCGLELETIMKHRLKIGMDVDEEFLENIQLEKGEFNRNKKIYSAKTINNQPNLIYVDNFEIIDQEYYSFLSNKFC